MEKILTENIDDMLKSLATRHQADFSTKLTPGC